MRARHYVVAAGAINSPALLLRSGAPDPHTAALADAFAEAVALTEAAGMTHFVKPLDVDALARWKEAAP